MIHCLHARPHLAFYFYEAEVWCHKSA